MASAELAFEKFQAALESTRGTAITAPTHAFPWPIAIDPERIRAKPDDARGTIVRNHRVKTTQTNATWSSEGAIDTDYLPFILQMVAKGSITPTTPTSATSARLWTATPTITSDDIKSATLWAGDPNLTTVRRAAYAMVEEFTVESDAGGEDGAAVYEAVESLDIPVRVMRARARTPENATDMSSSPTAPDLASFFKHGEVLVFPEHSHFLPMEAPDLVARHILEL